MRRLACALAIVFAGCGQPEPNAPQPPVSPAEAPPPVESSEPETRTITARVFVTDLEGAPLEGMVPIATRTPNAFDEPVARGAATGADGKASMSVTLSQRLYVRAWDPEFGYFANNYFDVLPAQGTETDEMAITMARGCGLSATLALPGGVAAANAPVKLYMEHPTRGPWWPGHGKTDAAGRVHFPSVPPGNFILSLEIDRAGQLEIPRVALPPGGNVDLGEMTLLPPRRDA